MKRSIILAIVITAMLAAAAGCAAKPGGPQGGDNGGGTAAIEVLEEDMRAIYESREKGLPVAVEYVFQGNGERVESPLYGDEAVNAALDAILEMRVTGEANIAVADNDSWYIFINADGSEAGSISFNGGNLVCGKKTYKVEGKKALAAIDFPAESSRDTLAIDGPDEKLAELLEKCRIEAPRRIKTVYSDGTEYELTDADAIKEAANAIYAIGLAYPWKDAGAPASSAAVTFEMNDGTSYSLLLYDESVYVYEFPSLLGKWCYCAEGADYFLAVLKGEKADGK